MKVENFAPLCCPGRHELDLTRVVERAGLYRLVTYDAIQAAQQRGAFGDDGGDTKGEKVGVYAVEDMVAAVARGGTAQYADYRGFRNATLNRLPVRHDAIEKLAIGFGSMGIHDPKPMAGKRTLAFDYADPGARPRARPSAGTQDVERGDRLSSTRDPRDARLSFDARMLAPSVMPHRRSIERR